MSDDALYRGMDEHRAIEFFAATNDGTAIAPGMLPPGHSVFGFTAEAP
jgi:hypothetical protein